MYEKCLYTEIFYCGWWELCGGFFLYILYGNFQLYFFAKSGHLEKLK